MNLNQKILSLLSLITISSYGQLDKFHNRICIGDSLIKQQIEYVDPGKPGKNITWDLSQAQVIREEYPIIYSSPKLIEDSIYVIGNDTILKRYVPNTEYFIKKEYGTMYYYQFKNDTISLIGHENPTVRLRYTEPLMECVFPLNYNDEFLSPYLLEGVYSNSSKILSSGNIKIKADAYGKIILPEGDTISPVLRVKTTQTICRSMCSSIYKDSIRPNVQDKVIETYKWYAKGYRYPVFETVHNIINDTLFFGTSFLFPPRQHTYTDIKDITRSDSLNRSWDIDKKNKSKNKDSETYQDGIGRDMSERNYEVFPNPTDSYLNIKYAITKPSRINISLYTEDGRLALKIEKDLSASGSYSEIIDFRDFIKGNYLLQITENKRIIFSKKVIKK
ncbi:MAG: T9SS type A sorting domain-containing protein [Coprobacter fastidiosus]